MEKIHPLGQTRWAKALAFLVSFLIPWVFILIVGEKEPQYDSWVYTQLSNVFQEKGLFNFAAYAEVNGSAYRGFLLPWLIALGAVTSRGIPFLNYGFYISLFCAITCSLALPALIEAAFSTKVSPWRRPIVSALFTLLFQGLLRYALSDLWAAGFGILAVTALVKAAEGQPRPWWIRGLYAVGSGACLAAAYHIRTIYLLLWLTLGLAAVGMMLFNRRIAWKEKLLWLPAMALGLVLASLPQIYSNAVTYGSASPMLLSDEGTSLFSYQLYSGIFEQKFESNIGVDYWQEGVDYQDDAGMLIMMEEGLEASFDYNDGSEYLGGVGDYLALVARYPLDFLGIYGRHFVNMMDMRYPELFVEEFTPNPLYPVVNYLALYLSLVAFLLYTKEMKKHELGRLWLLLAYLLPTFAICAGAVEPRFGLGLQLVLWGCLSGLPSAKLLKSLRGRDWVLMAVGLVAFFCMMAAVGGQTIAGFEELPMLYQ